MLNTQDRPMLKSCHSTKNIISLGQSTDSKGKMFSKKKNQVQMVTLCKTVGRGQINLGAHEIMHHSSGHSKILRKDSSSKNLRLGGTSSS